MTTSLLVRDLAARLDVPPGSVIEAAWAAGVKPLILDGQLFYDPAYLGLVMLLNGNSARVWFRATDAQFDEISRLVQPLEAIA